MTQTKPPNDDDFEEMLAGLDRVIHDKDLQQQLLNAGLLVRTEPVPDTRTTENPEPPEWLENLREAAKGPDRPFTGTPDHEHDWSWGDACHCGSNRRREAAQGAAPRHSDSCLTATALDSGHERCQCTCHDHEGAAPRAEGLDPFDLVLLEAAHYNVFQSKGAHEKLRMVVNAARDSARRLAPQERRDKEKNR